MCCISDGSQHGRPVVLSDMPDQRRFNSSFLLYRNVLLVGAELVFLEIYKIRFLGIHKGGWTCLAKQISLKYRHMFVDEMLA